MKTLTTLNKSLLALMLLLGCALSSTMSFAQVNIQVNSINVTGLNHFQGQFLTVYYATGNRASIATEEDQVNLREVKNKISNIPINSSTVSIPQVSLLRSGPMLPYNLIVFVVHSQPNFSWMNVTRTVPDGELMTQNVNYTTISSLTKNEYEGLKSSQGNPAIVQYIFGSRVNINAMVPNYNLNQ